MIFRNLIIIIISLIFLNPPKSFGMTILKKVLVQEVGQTGDEVDLVFDRSIEKSQIAIEYISNIVQLSIPDASVYPAKISSFQGKQISKFFAYQYSPKLVRCRFTVTGKAEDFKDKVELSSKGKVVKVRFGVPMIPVLSSQSVPIEGDLNEQALLTKVLEAKIPPVQEVHPSEPTIAAEIDRPSGVVLTGARPFPSVYPVFLKLGGVVLIFLVIALFAKASKKGDPHKKSKFLKVIQRFSKGRNGKDERMIEVLSTHHLDPKKSLAVVRVGKRTLVLGISSDAINLITQLPNRGDDSDDFDGRTDELVHAGKSFSDLLVAESETIVSTGPNVRSRIRSRLEGLKPL